MLTVNLGHASLLITSLSIVIYQYVTLGPTSVTVLALHNAAVKTITGVLWNAKFTKKCWEAGCFEWAI
jgi:hypothetical protein